GQTQPGQPDDQDQRDPVQRDLHGVVAADGMSGVHGDTHRWRRSMPSISISMRTSSPTRSSCLSRPKSLRRMRVLALKPTFRLSLVYTLLALPLDRKSVV